MKNLPNVLLIHADQHRWDCLGAYGNPDVSTPAIDRLAQEGTLYHNCFCAYPVCTPSRYSMLTGRPVHQHLGWSNRSTLLPGLDTFASVLRDNGYNTAAVGKMHFTPTYLDVGFEKLVLAEQDGPGRYDDDYHRHLQEHGLVDAVDLMDQVQEYRQHAPREYWETFGAMTSDLPEEHHSTTWIADRAMEVLREWQGGGNLLMVGFIKPHHPFDPPAPWDRMYDPDRLSLLPGWTANCLPVDLERYKGYFPNSELTEEKLRRIMSYYYGTISQIDHHVGRMLELLEQKGLFEDTLIIYTSDHGDYMGFHHMVLKGNYMYDPLVRLPLIIKYPGQTRASEASFLASNTDVAATIAAVTGADTRTLGGEDLRSSPKREYVYAECRGQYMVRSKNYKLILTQNPSQSLFFDLEADPLELDNRYKDPAFQNHIEAMKQALADWVLFKEPSLTYSDERARVIAGPNVTKAGDPRRSKAEAYFRAKMAEQRE